MESPHIPMAIDAKRGVITLGTVPVVVRGNYAWRRDVIGALNVLCYGLYCNYESVLVAVVSCVYECMRGVI